MDFDKKNNLKLTISNKDNREKVSKMRSKQISEKRRALLLLTLSIFLFGISFFMDDLKKIDFWKKKDAEIFVASGGTPITQLENSSNWDSYKDEWQNAYNRRAKLSEYKNFLAQGKGRYDNDVSVDVYDEIGNIAGTMTGEEVNYYFLFNYFYNYVFIDDMPESSLKRVGEIYVLEVN